MSMHMRGKYFFLCLQTVLAGKVLLLPCLQRWDCFQDFTHEGLEAGPMAVSGSVVGRPIIINVGKYSSCQILTWTGLPLGSLLSMVGPGFKVTSD